MSSSYSCLLSISLFLAPNFFVRVFNMSILCIVGINSSKAVVGIKLPMKALLMHKLCAITQFS